MELTIPQHVIQCSQTPAGSSVDGCLNVNFMFIAGEQDKEWIHKEVVPESANAVFLLFKMDP